MSGYQRISPGDGNHVQELNGDDTSVKGYRTSGCWLGLYYLLNAVLLGMPALLMKWYPDWKISLTCSPCSLNIADRVLVKDENQENTICKVRTEVIDFIPDDFASRSASTRQLQHQNSRTPLCDAENAGSVYRFFIFHDEKYVWDDIKDLFKRIEGLTDLTCEQIAERFRGMCPNRRVQLSLIYGINEITVEVKSYFKLLVDEVLNPFYMFQVFSVLLWCFDEYYYYAVCVVLISAISIGVSLYKTRQQSVTLSEMARGGDNFVTIRLPGGDEAEISFRDLVPGDIILIPPEGCIMPCDAVVIQGSCIVNESMLTGESVPVNKSAVQPSDEIFSCESHKKHIIFCGTQVIQPRFYAGNKVACVVIRTGFSTLKGQLIRSIMYPKEVGFKFYADAMKFILLLFLVALGGMFYGTYLYWVRGTTWYVLLIRVLDIVTIVVPPALPAAMTVGTLNAQGRLKKHNIFCISPQRINFCGKLKLICFDKTGTLTEEGLNLSCVVPTVVGEDNVEEFGEPVTNPQTLPMSSHLLRGMATCHSLTFIKENIVGDPLDLKMFESTGWILEEPQKDDNTRYDLLAPNVVKNGETELGIIKEFDFTPQLQRMSVVACCVNTQQMIAYCKGAPEKIKPLCTSVPENFDRILDAFTLKGYRVLGLAWKRVERISWHTLQKIPREKIESDLHFGGFLVMQNSLKPATIPVIRDLTGASVRCVMVTGDNMLTALSVARECGMIPAQDKVVIVNATDDGQLEYTLASQHYEDSDTPDTSRVSNNNGESDVSFRSDSDAHHSSHQPLSKRFSLDSNASETQIDMEKLIPFGSDLIKDSNYHLALTGKTWAYLMQNCSKSEFQKIVAKGTVFARMSPECKMQLVESLQEMDYVVAMCGDGANDCSALSTAHVGISLSEAEASVAAPFTSKTADISCVPVLIREGRCALVTSFGIFKYMALYSMVQFASVLILYTHYTNLADAQFLWIDLAITSTVTIAMGRTEPVRRLVSKRPMGSLISFSNVFSIFSQIVVCVATQLFAIEVLKGQGWFVPVQPATADDLETLCWETTTIFSISSFQYLIMSIVFSKGKPFRKPFYLNGYLLSATVLLTGFTALLMVYPVSGLATFFSLEPVSMKTQTFRYILIIFPVINTVISIALENIVSTSKPIKWFGKSFWKKSQKSMYKEILKNLEKDKSWPPVRAC